MKFIVSSGALLKQLQIVGGVLNNNNTLPILDNFLFDLKANQLSISASDLETTISASLEVQSEDEGLIAIPARLLLDGIKALPEQPVTFISDDSSGTIEISSENGKYSLAFVPGDEFPKLPEMEDVNSTTLAGEILATAITKSIFAAGNDDLRPVMSGVFFQFSSENLTFVATDAHKLVRYRRNDRQSDATAEFIMPHKPLTILKSTLASIGDEVHIHYNETNARFEFENIILTCRLIDGKYPNYEAVIPKDNPNVLEINRSTFLASVKRVAIFSNKTTHQVRLKITGSELQITAEDVDFSNKAHERLTCSYQGEDMEIGFNSRFLTEMLSNLESDDIQLEMSAPNRAGIITPADSLEEGEEVLMLVMPVMLNS
jgi:DNA polymerase-3 subunit beta